MPGRPSSICTSTSRLRTRLSAGSSTTPRICTPRPRPAGLPTATALSPEARWHDRQLTYEELGAAANRIAHQLIRTGSSSGRPVGILRDRCLDMTVAALAVLVRADRRLRRSACSPPGHPARAGTVACRHAAARTRPCHSPGTAAGP
ncbi:AMP-binding protein [Streptomyces sp. DH18]|uniref:AMP-binding protein n=1 Tax=Streptomyces sp. DH18 TaxID=3040126 RepID=UPI003FA76459